MVQLTYKLSRHYKFSEGKRFIEDATALEGVTASELDNDRTVELSVPEDTVRYVRQIMEIAFDEV